MNHAARLADPSYPLARADYDSGWWAGFQGLPCPLDAPNVTRGYLDGVGQRSSWEGQNTARRLACQLLGQPITAAGPRLP